MKGRQVILGRLGRREAAALMVDGRLEDVFIDPDSQIDLEPGAICRAVVERLMKGQGGAFLRLPDGQRGYLRERAGAREGRSMLVQISGAAEGSKAVPVSGRLIFRGKNILIAPGAPGVNVSRQIRDSELRERLQEVASEALGEFPHGVIIRSAAARATEAELVEELTGLLDLVNRIVNEPEGAPELLLDAPTPWERAWTEWSDPEPDDVEKGEDSFQRCGVDDALDALRAKTVPLVSGANAIIETTSALTAVDVNTGTDSSVASGLKANIALARELPRQLRLRGLGGQIVLDFAPMPKRDRATLEQILRKAFSGEAKETTLIGWTKMGLFEINRKRDRIPLLMLLERQ